MFNVPIMMLQFQEDSHAEEWQHIFDQSVERYAKCYEQVQQRVFGNAHLAIAAGEMYDCVRQITDELLYDANSVLRKRYNEDYRNSEDYISYLNDDELNEKIDQRIKESN